MIDLDSQLADLAKRLSSARFRFWFGLKVHYSEEARALRNTIRRLEAEFARLSAKVKRRKRK